MLKKLLSQLLPPREGVFFEYFEESVDICHQLSIVFCRMTCDGVTDELLMLTRQLKRDNNQVTKKIQIKLNTVFLTPIDREDIQNIAILLNKIARTIAKSASFFKTYHVTKSIENLTQQAVTLQEACGELKSNVLKFKNFKNIHDLIESNEKMDAIETQGDEIMYVAMSDLFSGKYDALEVIKLRDLHKHIEKALDLCFLLSNLLINVSLKHT